MPPEAPQGADSGEPPGREESPPEPRPRTESNLPIEAFHGEDLTRDLEDWHAFWRQDRTFPVTSHRGGLIGRLVVSFKRLLRPLVKIPQADLWDRQKVFNLVILERMIAQRYEKRIAELESFVPRALDDVLRHNDALFSRVDQKLDRHRREARSLLEALGSALAVAETAARPETETTSEGERPGAAVASLSRMRDEGAYLELERRFRGTEEEIRKRIAEYLPRLEEVAELGPVLDLGCGRGESLSVLVGAGIPARGVDASAAMVRRCRERGLEAVEGDLFETLAAVEEGSLGGVVSFHVIEHLEPESLDRLTRLALRALAPGGRLILETPNPLSVTVAARSFWLDPTHRRPVHPDTLVLLARLAGFDPVERLDLRPFPEDRRLPEIDPSTVPADQAALAERVNRLRDRLDGLLFGYQDYAVVATRPEEAGG